MKNVACQATFSFKKWGIMAGFREIPGRGGGAAPLGAGFSGCRGFGVSRQCRGEALPRVGFSRNPELGGSAAARKLKRNPESGGEAAG
ncbi:MAG: hypothetical protein IKO40_07175 [Kiritimatiellae bacterium]|nr:hypothetical protein [Kiritimatiellia bacterium]